MRCKMEEFDKRMRERAAREPCPIPEDYAGRVFTTLAGLQEEPVKARRRSRWPVWAAAALALLITVPNASPTAAAAMMKVPVLGAIVRVVTFRDYTYDDGYHQADISVPELEGSQGAQAVDQQVQAYTDRLIGDFEALCRAELGQESYHGLDVSSSVITDSDTWFTLRIDAVETQASSYKVSRFYHIDKTMDQIVTLGDLFREGADYSGVLRGEVLRQMTEQADQVDYYLEEVPAVGPEQNFYLNEDGDLVLVFDQYSVAAGYVGAPEFTISRDVYSALLK